MDIDPPQSRLFVVCGRAIEAEALQAAFSPYGCLQNIKIVKDKGVAYVKFDRASSAALAIENLNGAVLNDGRGPKLKVMLAEAPSARGVQPTTLAEPEATSDPDNLPPRSRLFIVVPKQADAQQILDHMSKFSDLDYCKTDLIASKGVVFCKFHKSSAALSAMEEISEGGNLAGYKVKCMLAEPKTKRRADGSPMDIFGHLSGQPSPKLDYNLGGVSVDASSMQLKMPMNSLGMSEYAAIGGLSGLTSGLGGFQLPGSSSLADMQGLGTQVGLGFVGGLGHLQAGSPVSPNNNNSPISKQRLFLVVHKGVTEEMIARLFRKLPGMEYCDLKKDRVSGKSKGFCYINYSTPEAAQAAIDQLNGAEFPPHSGHRIKVMYAEPLGIRGPSHGTGSGSRTSPSISVQTNSSMQTPMSRNLSPDVQCGVPDNMSGMAVQRVASAHGHLDQIELAARMMSPASSASALNNMAHQSPVPARELMFNVQ